MVCRPVASSCPALTAPMSTIVRMPHCATTPSGTLLREAHAPHGLMSHELTEKDGDDNQYAQLDHHLQRRIEFNVLTGGGQQPQRSDNKARQIRNHGA